LKKSADRREPSVTKAPGESTEARILVAIRAVPAGSVAGYGVIARRAGLPGRARLVAKILSGNDDATLPWHRILRSDGRIAFPSGSKGHAEQTRRLRGEGVKVEAGRVRGMQRTDTDLDALLWAPSGRGRR
jgi:methylated-DNA-protein-cysteine methyltransferase-like protein